MRKLLLWASMILVCYFASDVSRVPTSALLGISVPTAVHITSN